MSCFPTRDKAVLEDTLTASELLAKFGGIPGPDLRDPRSIHKRRRLASVGLPTYARAARRGSCCNCVAVTRVDGAPKSTIGVATVWSANAPPAQPGA
jgi:hypothetical protein